MASPPREMVLPFGVDSLGRIAFSENPYAQIISHIQMIVGTRLNERVMNPDYGVDANGYLFLPNNAQNLDRLTLEVENAIRDWEPLVEVQSVDASQDEAGGVITISVYFSLVGTDSDSTDLQSAIILLGGTVVASRG